jgi:hypothetical protein
MTKLISKLGLYLIAGCSLALLIAPNGLAFARGGAAHNHPALRATYVDLRDHRQGIDTSWFCADGRGCFGTTPMGTGRDHRTYRGGAQGSGGVAQGRHHLN